jgi:hypothetical protein
MISFYIVRVLCFQAVVFLSEMPEEWTLLENLGAYGKIILKMDFK